MFIKQKLVVYPNGYTTNHQIELENITKYGTIVLQIFQEFYMQQ